MNDETQLSDAKVKEMEDAVINAIKKNELIFFSDIPAFIGVSRATLYNYGLDKLDSIKDALRNNKITLKVAMRKKWYKDPNASLQIALMKLLASDEERKKLSQSYVDVTTDGEKIKDTIDVKKLSDEMLESLEQSFEEKADE